MQVSIIIPFKNAASWLEETISSILEQTYVDWELICIDDNSIDNGKAIINSFSDKRIRVIPNVGNGIIPALQLGLECAQGEYITRMDADDKMTPRRLELMLSKIEHANPRTIVTGKVKYFANCEVSEGFIKYEQWINERIEQGDFYNHIYRECVVASPNWLARKEDLIMHNIFNNLKYPEDYDMVFQWMQNGYTIETVDEVTLLWRDHPGRTSKNSETYNQQALFKLKLDWFIRLNELEENSLAIFGAGTKGKITARVLIDNSVGFNWYDINYQNYSTIDGIEIQDPSQSKEDLLLLCIYPENREGLEAMLTNNGYDMGKNAWYL